MSRTAPLLLKPKQPAEVMLSAFVNAMLNLGHEPEKLIQAMEAKAEVMRHVHSILKG